VSIVALVAALAFATSSCDGSGPSDGGIDAVDVPPADLPDSGIPGVSIDLGTGQDDFEEIPRTGAPNVQLIHGPQGGYHVWGRVKFSGFQPDVDIWFIATRLSDGVVLHDASVLLHRWIASGVSFGLADLGGGTFATEQGELIVLQITCPAQVLGDQLFIRAFVRERATGRIAADWRTVTVVRDLPSPECPDL
jgi:hypothetical protein